MLTEDGLCGFCTVGLTGVGCASAGLGPAIPVASNGSTAADASSFQRRPVGGEGDGMQLVYLCRPTLLNRIPVATKRPGVKSPGRLPSMR